MLLEMVTLSAIGVFVSIDAVASDGVHVDAITGAWLHRRIRSAIAKSSIRQGRTGRHGQRPVSSTSVAIDARMVRRDISTPIERM